ncbi:MULTISPECIES: helix-turn-helix domain-containing protein [unclassified Micromonospora]|uniref:helix-turn-helix domain-containing protein n=1 Tax=unclassified Micromonospora TaxID=2617518 RepID=UPI0036A7D9E2|nr:helix-turn-helix domain-containing protein [Micromonospora sp. NBC_00858]
MNVQRGFASFIPRRPGASPGARSAGRGPAWPGGRRRHAPAGAAQRIKDGAIPEQVAADLGISRSTLYRELRKHREGSATETIVEEG